VRSLFELSDLASGFGGLRAELVLYRSALSLMQSKSPIGHSLTFLPVQPPTPYVPVHFPLPFLPPTFCFIALIPQLSAMFTMLPFPSYQIVSSVQRRIAN